MTKSQNFGNQKKKRKNWCQIFREKPQHFCENVGLFRQNHRLFIFQSHVLRETAPKYALSSQLYHSNIKKKLNYKRGPSV